MIISNDTNQNCLETSFHCKSKNYRKSSSPTTKLSLIKKRLPKDILRTSPTMSFKQENPIFSNQHQISTSSLHPSFSHPRNFHSTNLADSNIRSLVNASLGRTFTKSRRFLVVVVGTLVLLANVLDRLGASLCDGGSVAVVAVDADEVLSIAGLDVVDGDFSSTAICGNYVSGFTRMG